MNRQTLFNETATMRSLGMDIKTIAGLTNRKHASAITYIHNNALNAELKKIPFKISKGDREMIKNG